MGLTNSSAAIAAPVDSTIADPSGVVMSALTFRTANELVAAAVNYAAEAGVPSTVTVVDDGGRVVAMGRMDHAPLISIATSAAKARTSAVFGGVASGDLAMDTEPGAPLFAVGEASTEPLAFLAGGVPLLRSGIVIGAIGACCGVPDQDHEIAIKAATAVLEPADVTARTRIRKDHS
jgi:uncharacterized protein GlcG (DUF336 family)